tara:strand:- start:1988 stop:2689 length:702 start_codon:yes stop_codon:yes gene_type:complete
MSAKVNTVAILAGGKGTRMREQTEFIPKPMVEIGELPILVHLINHFNKFGDFKFIICTGYKEEIIFDYFKKNRLDNVKLLETGFETNTGGRIFQLKDLIKDDFIMTYGDGLSDVNINELINFHDVHKKTATITVTKPTSRFGLVNFDEKGKVKKFIEKPMLDSYINMGYMVLKQKVFEYLDDNVVFENEPLINLSKDEEIYAFKHKGFFRPMDTYREYLELKDMWDSGNAPWK